ncbi:hypothetical protein ARMGADRAFT_436505 [Armillaria gallica]|uniref:Uncharacterized protein n=1 Tax=Armillaria gallica TaxID=47427 RepID=A0A2H3DBN5_ARMGA|nr:hypothetical protein ARMGADRAFT_436505 [Armillaria gallica]
MGRQDNTAGSGSKPIPVLTASGTSDAGSSSQRVCVPSHMKAPKASQPNAHAPSNGDTKSSTKSAR